MNRHAGIDYSLQRRALLADLSAGRVSVNDVCDAHPYLQRAARFHGDKTDRTCPVCRREKVTLVHYVYGEQLKIGAGQAKTGREIESMARRLREFNVYVVEVCRGCDWNHLVESFSTGLPAPTEVTSKRSRSRPNTASR